LYKKKPEETKVPKSAIRKNDETKPRPQLKEKLPETRFD
jgi:hypothetical protein